LYKLLEQPTSDGERQPQPAGNHAPEVTMRAPVSRGEARVNGPMPPARALLMCRGSPERRHPGDPEMGTLSSTTLTQDLSMIVIISLGLAALFVGSVAVGRT
jgi:hypothetical protein